MTRKSIKVTLTLTLEEYGKLDGLIRDLGIDPSDVRTIVQQGHTSFAMSLNELRAHSQETLDELFLDLEREREASAASN